MGILRVWRHPFQRSCCLIIGLALLGSAGPVSPLVQADLVQPSRQNPATTGPRIASSPTWSGSRGAASDRWQRLDRLMAPGSTETSLDLSRTPAQPVPEPVYVIPLLVLIFFLVWCRRHRPARVPNGIRQHT